MAYDAEALVIGSGFGGAVLALRLGQVYPGQVIVLERGQRYGMGSFPRSPHDMAKNFYYQADEKRRRPRFVRQKSSAQVQTGLFDVRSFARMDVVQAAGLGGGSLIYANVFLEAPAAILQEKWPKSCQREQLNPYYAICREVLGARLLPEPEGAADRVVSRVDYFRKVAEKMGRKSEKLPIMVHFGNDPKQPLPRGQQELNRYGALQSSCTYCAECDIGCNVHAKNTLDLNYLFAAEQRHGVRILCEHEARGITPLNAEGEADARADGRYGYAVEALAIRAGETKVFRVKKLILAAGTLGTNELLLQARDRDRTLPKISSRLGIGFSGNGDFLSAVIGAESQSGSDPNPTYGPVITQRIDFHLLEDYRKHQAFIMEDASYPNLLAWYIEGEKPEFLKWRALWDGAKALLLRLLRQPHLGSMGSILNRFLARDLSQSASIHLCMGVDRSDGRLHLSREGHIDLKWQARGSMPLYRAITQAVHDFAQLVKASHAFHLPSWNILWKRNVTVHPLGGCALAEDASSGVCEADPQRFGAVFSYQNLYVADGSLFPSAVGSNPAATIAALAERVAEGITGRKPGLEF